MWEGGEVKTKELFKNIYNYYLRTRATGHTFTAVQGLIANPESLMVANQALAENLRYTYKELRLGRDRFISVEKLASPKMYGVEKPIIWDNFSIIEILGMALSEIERLEAKLQECKNDKT